jgi:hypothetical protein
MTDIYTLGIKADTTDIDRGKKSLDDFSGAADKASKRTEEIRAGVDRAGKAAFAFGIVAAAAMGAVAVKAGNAAREIEKLSLLSGQNAEEFQRATFAARAYGIEQEKLSDIFKDTQDKVGDFLATGGGELINFFEKVAPLAGVTKESFRGLSGQEGLQLYVDSLEKANVGQEEMVFFMEAIGNDSTALLPLLKNNGEEFKRLGDRASALGIVLDEIDLENLTEMNRALNELGAVSTAAGNVIGATLAPFITDLTNSFIDSAGSADHYRESILNIAQSGIAVAGVFADAGRVFEILGKSIGAFAFQTGEELSTISQRFNLLYASYQVFARKFDVVTATWINSLLKMGAEGSEDFVNYFIDGLNDLVKAVTGNGILGKVLDELGVSIGKISNIEIEAPAINTSELAQSLDFWETRQGELEESLVGSNAAIAAAWADVMTLILEPIPSEGMDDWFNKLREGIELTRELALETKGSGKEQEKSVKGLAKTWDQSLSETGSAVNALSTIFAGNEKAQKALHKVSQAIAIAEAFQSVQKIAMGTTEAGVHVANETTKQGANALTAITAAFAAPFPVNFIAGAAMVGIMASLVGGISGGGGGASFDPTDDRQEGQVTGSVLGSSDKSGSINKSQERFEDIAIDQLSELRGIRGSLNNIGSGIAQLGKGLVTSNVGDFGGFTGKISGSLGFSSTRTDLLDSGVNFIKQTFEDIIDRGFVDVQQYFDTKTKKTSWFGLSSSTSFDTAFQAISGGVNEQIAAIFKDIGSTVLQAATTLGFKTTSVTTSTITQSFEDFDREGLRGGSLRFFETIFTTTEESLEDALQMFSVDIGKISLEGLSGEEIQAELEAVFSQQADLIAEYLVPSIAEFQNVGEGLFDTLLRVTQEQAVFNDALSNMGVSLADIGNVLQIEIAQGIISLVGGAERFSDLTQSFFSDFYSEAEKFDVLTGSITDVFGDLGVALSDNREAFRELVEGQDLTTEAGRQLFATLLEIAPAMDSYFDTLEERAAEELALAERTASDKARLDEKAASDALRLAERTASDLIKEQEKAAQEAVRVATEQSNLTVRLLSLQGKAEEALALSREMQLASTTESLRPLLELIFAEEDLIAARVESGEVLEELIDIEQINRDRTLLTIRLLELQGKAEEALTLVRERELQNTTESLRPLLDLIFAEEDLIASRNLAEQASIEAAQAENLRVKAAEESANELLRIQDKALQQAVKLESDRTALNITLLGLQGEAEQALTLVRERELENTTESLKPLLELIFAEQDLIQARKTAEDAAVDAASAEASRVQIAEESAREILRIQEEAAQSAIKLEADRMGLSIRLLGLQGESEEALALTRERELAATDGSLKSLLELIFAEEDLIKARNESEAAAITAAQAESDRIQLAEKTASELLRIQEDAAQAAIKLEADRTTLNIKLLDLQGESEQALSLIRERELANTNDALKPLLELIFAEEDLIKSRELSEIAANELEAANLTAAKAAQDLADATIKQAEAAEVARQDLANAAFTMLNKSIDLEKQRLQAVLDVSKEAYNAELSRLTGLRNSLNEEKSARETNLANSTAALTASFDAEVNAINATKDARINSLNTERSAVASNMQMLLGLADKFSQKITDTSTLDQALAAAKRGDFSVAEQLQVKEIDSGGFGSASELNVAQALQANKLQTLSGLASTAAGQAGNKLSGIDRQIASAERSAVMQIGLLETQRDSLLNIDAEVLPLSESTQQYQDSQLALTKLAYDDEIAKLDMLVESNQEVYDLHENSYNEQIQSLTEIAEASQEQLDALLNIDSSVLSVSDAIAALAQAPALNNSTDETSAELVRLAQENKDAQAAIAKSSAATAAILQRLELGGLDTRTIT